MPPPWGLGFRHRNIRGTDIRIGAGEEPQWEPRGGGMYEQAELHSPRNANQNPVFRSSWGWGAWEDESYPLLSVPGRKGSFAASRWSTGNDRVLSKSCMPLLWGLWIWLGEVLERPLFEMFSCCEQKKIFSLRGLIACWKKHIVCVSHHQF